MSERAWESSQIAYLYIIIDEFSEVNTENGEYSATLLATPIRMQAIMFTLNVPH